MSNHFHSPLEQHSLLPPRVHFDNGRKLTLRFNVFHERLEFTTAPQPHFELDAVYWTRRSERLRVFSRVSSFIQIRANFWATLERASDGERQRHAWEHQGKYENTE